ncbi:metallophosphatase family protein [Marinobacter daepoensis]|uniref:Metallophosphoesterase family protein n=1 Tax=Marinobacter daepoensis TaxID=262077 RepID=A0ABS3BI44_9GAMM|nr:metallophosphoesterase family protein [Marinobacter daepoensis]MBN7771514.1 metallophosphoesterase family protein [Marinobacter daepoensis]MBY6080114.1 metallophosphatase family protein [Marinobacter daepoensis]
MFTGRQAAEISLVGDGPDRAALEKRIQAALCQDAKQLEHGKKFTGKPGTLIFERQGDIVKIHAGVEMAAQQAGERAAFNLRQEKMLGIYHPRKAWFVAKQGDVCWLGNIMPVLQPLHVLISPSDPSEALKLLDQYFAIYIRFMKEQERVLDPGLSNFAADSEGRVFYLDDDIYGWDGFSSLTQAIGVWFRQMSGFPEDFFGLLGERVGRCLEQQFAGSAWGDIVSEQIRSVFVANDEQANRRDRFLAGLAGVKYGNAREPAEELSFRYAVPASSSELFESTFGKVAILADIHANLPALERVLEELESRSVSQVLVLGDLVGYGPHPSECIELLRSRDFHIIRGNHDHAAASGEAGKGFSAMARWVIDWTVGQLSRAERGWLGSLPLYMDGPGWLAVHGAPQDRTFMNGYVYRMTYEDNLQNLRDREIRFCFHGHTHVAGVYYDKGKLNGHSVQPRFNLGSVDRSLICPGSIGQPRGGKAGLEFAILDRASLEMEFLNLDYDVSRVIGDMSRAGFPSQLSDRLRVGK